MCICTSKDENIVGHLPFSFYLRLFVEINSFLSLTELKCACICMFMCAYPLFSAFGGRDQRMKSIGYLLENSYASNLGTQEYKSPISL